MIKNILWRFDGVLFDTSSAMTFAVSKTLKQMGLLVPLNVIDGLVRQSFEHCVLTFSKRLKMDAGELRSQFMDAYLKVSPASQAPFSGASRVCEFIYTQGGLNFGITHHSVQSAQTLLDVHNLAPFFNNIFLKDQWDLSRTYPTLVLAILRKYALCPVETLLIGNSDVDIQAGRAAGVHTGLFGQSKLMQSADIQIQNYNQLLIFLHEAYR